jgi:Chaperone of endosialidase/Collagen triple helix repeat (20 copies)
LPGVSGTSGTSGTGSSGTNGTSGTSGSTGSPGSSGTSGSTGSPGSSGTSGSTGAPGTSGTSGTSGTRGTSGTSGSTGSPGTSGTSGANGSSGTSGANGSSGTSGTSGVTGSPGSSGTSGTSASVTINNNTDNYLVTATGTTNTLNGESALTMDGTTFTANTTNFIVNSTNITIGNDTTDVIGIGNNTMYVNSSNVGIGTTSPTLKLQVVGGAIFTAGSSTNTALYFSPSNDNTLNSGYGYNGDDYDMWVNYRGYLDGFTRYRDFRVGNGRAGVIAFFQGSTSYVGIGTTSPDAVFHVAKSSAGGVGGQVVIDNPAASTLGNTAEISFLTDAGASGAGTRNARILAVNENAGNGAARMELHTWDGSTSATRMTILSGGNVGIGTTSPSNKLDVFGNALIQGTQGFNATGETATLYIGDGASYLQAVYDGGLDFYQNATFRMRIQGGTGNVGIGTTSPSAKVHVVSSGTSASEPTMFLIQNSAYGSIFTLDQYHGLVLRGYPTSNSSYAMTGADVMSFMEYGGVFRFYLKNASSLTLQGELNNGSLTVTGNLTAYGTPSDIKLKENIKPLTNSLDKILQIEGVSFDWKEDTNEAKMVKLKEDIGFIAQQIHSVVPELARIDENSGIMAVRDRGIIALLVEAVKELNAKIDKLEGKY